MLATPYRNCFVLWLLMGFCIMAKNAESQTPKSMVSFKKLRPSHPRLFASDAQVANIKKQSDSISLQLLAIIRADAENFLSAPIINYPNNISNFGTSRAVEGRIIALSLAWRLFNDERYLRKAKEELLQLASITNWGTGHFLDLGEASLAAGIGYDWLYHKLTVEERRIITEAIKQKALLPSLQVKEGSGSWVDGNFNWNPVCHGGLISGALAIAETEPDLCTKVVSRAVKNIPVAGDAYSPDGSFAEGPSYWSYGTSFYVLAVEALRSALGSSYGLEKIPGFLKTADYNNQMVGATGSDYNYADYHTEYLNEPVMLWFARELNRPDLAVDEKACIQVLACQATAPVCDSRRKLVQNRQTPMELLWWNPSLLQQTTMVKAPLQWTANGLMPIGVMRSAWGDSTAGFVAIKGGTPNNSHAHMDVGSFILEAAGIRWAIDLGTESYDKMRAARLDLWNYSQNSSRWTTFRCGPEGHSILRFDGERQLITGKGEITELKTKNGAMGEVANLTSLYSDKAKKVTRTVMLYPDRSFSIADEWVTKAAATEESFQWLTRATVTKTGDGLLLQQAGKYLRIKIEQPASPNDLTVEVQDVSAAKNPQDSPNPGVSRIIIKTKTSANSSGKLLLRVIPSN